MAAPDNVIRAKHRPKPNGNDCPAPNRGEVRLRRTFPANMSRRRIRDHPRCATGGSRSPREWQAAGRSRVPAPGDLRNPPAEITGIFRPAEDIGTPEYLLGIDEATFECDFLGAADFDALPCFDGPHERGRIMKAVVSARIEPGVASSEFLDFEVAPPQIDAVDVGDLELTPRRWFDGFRDFDDVVVIEVKTGDCPVRLRPHRFLNDLDHLVRIRVEHDAAVALGIVD